MGCAGLTRVSPVLLATAYTIESFVVVQACVLRAENSRHTSVLVFVPTAGDVVNSCVQ